MFDRTTFMRNTRCEFTPCETPDRKPDYISDSGSEYWFERDGVIRRADHWGRVSSCLWKVQNDTYSDEKTTAYAPFTAFRLTRGELLRNMVRSYRSAIAEGSELRCTYVPRDRRGNMRERVVVGIVTRVSDAFVTIKSQTPSGYVFTDRLTRRLIYPHTFTAKDACDAESFL